MCGLLAMLAERRHRQHGWLSWATLFQPAIALASDGFPISLRLHRLIADRLLCNSPTSKEYFLCSRWQRQSRRQHTEESGIGRHAATDCQTRAGRLYRGPLDHRDDRDRRQPLAGEPG